MNPVMLLVTLLWQVCRIVLGLAGLVLWVLVTICAEIADAIQGGLDRIHGHSASRAADRAEAESVVTLLARKVSE